MAKIKLQLSPEIYNALGLPSFVALDLETTGLNASADEVIEIGAARVESGKITDTFSRLVNIRGELPLQITRLTGIRSVDLQSQPFLHELLPEFVDWINGAPILGHNISFDLGFLDDYLTAQQTLFHRGRPLGPLRNPRLDTLILARTLLPRLNNHRLETLISFFEIDVTTTHRALDDVFSEIQLFDRLLPLLLTLPESLLRDFSQILVPLTDGTSNLIRRSLQAAQKYRTELLETAAYFRNKIPAPLNNIVGEKRERRVSEDPALLDEDSVAAIFDDKGLLNSVRPDFEKREQQMEMARAVSRAFNEQAFLLAEAGTGTGKSLAYLVPSILWAQRQPLENGRVIVSTNTKNLQEQIFTKDLPFLFQHLPEPFRAVLLKGRTNYICIDRWKQFLAGAHEEMLTDEERREVLPIVTWFNETLSGDIEENNGFHRPFYPDLWGRLQADSHFCPGQSCPYFQDCFVTRARRAARTADVVVTNHSLLLSDLTANRAILSDYSNLILDEAHNLEAAATKYLSVELSSRTVKSFLHQLYRFVGKEVGMLPRLRDALHFSPMEDSRKSPILNLVYALIQQTETLEKACRRFFLHLGEKAWEQNLGRNQPLTAKIRYSNWDDHFSSLETDTKNLREELGELKTALARLNDHLSLLTVRDLEDVETFRSLAEGALSQAADLLETVALMVETNRPDFVYWCEPAATDKKYDSRLKASPVNVASVLKNRLYDFLDTAVFTSATLTVGGRFDYFKSRTGIAFVDTERVVERSYGSPFHYEEQVLLGVPAFVPDPRDSRFVEKISGLVGRLISETKRGTLILFTSYDMLQRVYRYIKPRLEGEGILTLAQGVDGSRNSLVRLFQEEGSAVLLGTNSFWEGVDIPGEALELLVVTKLPFEVPAEPIFQAWMEEIEKRGGNSF
ncbi:MAG: DEAD/DEAH box helicase family protein, partial [Calditrichaeota bacterium]|nr:DEAD/DEAH box helicase family protein [Calditrichota bacterium]